MRSVDAICSGSSLVLYQSKPLQLCNKEDTLSELGFLLISELPASMLHFLKSNSSYVKEIQV